MVLLLSYIDDPEEEQGLRKEIMSLVLNIWGLEFYFKTFKLCRTDNWIDRSKRRSLAENKFGGLVLSFIKTMKTYEIS